MLKTLVHIQDAALLPDDTMLVSLDAPDGIDVDVVQLAELPADGAAIRIRHDSAAMLGSALGRPAS